MSLFHLAVLIVLFISRTAINLTLFNVIDFTNEEVKSISIVQRVLHELKKKHGWSALKIMVCKKHGSDKKTIPILHVMSVKPMMSVVLRSNTLRDVCEANVLTADADHIREVFKQCGICRIS